MRTQSANGNHTGIAVAKRSLTRSAPAVREDVESDEAQKGALARAGFADNQRLGLRLKILIERYAALPCRLLARRVLAAGSGSLRPDSAASALRDSASRSGASLAGGICDFRERHDEIGLNVAIGDRDACLRAALRVPPSDRKARIDGRNPGIIEGAKPVLTLATSNRDSRFFSSSRASGPQIGSTHSRPKKSSTNIRFRFHPLG